ncbi:hypothetical protein CHS0354_039012, partial [Potamilus streckersoni]
MRSLAGDHSPSGDVPCPAYLYLRKHSLCIGDPCLFEDFSVGDKVIPVNVEDGAGAALMEAFKDAEEAVIEEITQP